MIRIAIVTLCLATTATAQLPISVPALALEATTPRGWRVDTCSTSEVLVLRRSKQRHPVLRVYFWTGSGSEGPTPRETFAFLARQIGGDERLVKVGETSPLGKPAEGQAGRSGTVIEGASEDASLLMRCVQVPNPDGSAHLFWLTTAKSTLRKTWEEALDFIHASRFLPPPKPADAQTERGKEPPAAVWRDARSGIFFANYPDGFIKALGSSGNIDGDGLRLEPADEDERERASITLQRKVVSPRVTARSMMKLILASLDDDTHVLNFTYTPALVAERSAWKIEWTVLSSASTEGHVLWLFQRERSIFSVEWVGDPAWKKEHSSLLRSFIKAIGLPSDD